MHGTVHSEQRGPARWLVLENGPKNLLTPPMMRELVRLLIDGDASDEVQAFVLTGAGEMFCGGLDVEAIRAGGDPVEYATELVAVLRCLPALGTPVVAAVNGDALASGFSLVVAADMAVTVDDARLGTVEASIGIWPMIAQVPLLQRLAPRHALSNVLTGVPFTAAQALAFGAVNEVVDRETLSRRVDELIPVVTAAGPALPAGRRAFYRFIDLPYGEALDQSLAEFTAMFTRS